MQRRHLIALAAATALWPLADAHAQGEKTIRVLVGFPSGGSIDTVVRLLANKMKDDLKANIVIESQPDAGGSAADLTRLEQASTARWAPVVRATGLRAD